MRRSFRYNLLAFALCGGLVGACAPAGTTGHSEPESNRNIVTAADIEKTPDMPIELIIQRKVPGVSVHNINGVMIMQIRGATGLTTEDMKPTAANPSPPMYVLNGIRAAAGPSGEMPNIPSREIQTIRVLKGADAAIYGLEGGNGVIEITTKGH